MKHKALIITPEGDYTITEYDNNTEYKVLSEGVGGYIELVRLPETAKAIGDGEISMWVNEEGRIKGLPYNHFGSLLYTMNFRTDEPIVGNIVLTGGSDPEGYTVGLTDEQLDALQPSWRDQPYVEAYKEMVEDGLV